MTILLILLAFHLLALAAGKFVNKINYLGYLFIGILTLIQVAVFAYLLFTMEVPTF